MQNKKMIGILALAVIVVIAIGGGIFYYTTQKKKPEDVLQAFVTRLNEKDYEGAYAYLAEKSKTTYDADTFLQRNANIYTGIGAQNIQIEVSETKKGAVGEIVVYTQTMDTLAGMLTFSNEVEIVQEDDYKILWSSTFIHPELEDINHIQVQVEEGKRGTIYDRNDKVLAEDGTAMQVGIVPGKLGEDKDTMLAALAEKLDMEITQITNKLEAAWVKDDLFVPIKTIKEDDTMRNELLSLAGVQINTASARVYPYAKKAAHLTGYVHLISAEELEAHKDEGYTQEDRIGEVGLEAAYESTLRGENGYEIYITTVSGDYKSTIIEKKVVHGTNLHTTIDMELQVAGYDKILAHQDSGSLTAMNPKTGEVLALVSAPAYDPNDFSLGMSDATWKALNEDVQTPLMNRFASAYTPGSTFKAITAGIGLDTNTIRPEEAFDKAKDWKWQADDSWGDYYVTTMKEYSEPSNLRNALINSDNIYFAQLATRIGSDSLAEKLTALGFESSLEFDIPLTSSTYGENGSIAKGSALADTGFGQGKLQVNPLHLTALYSVFGNDGSIMRPYLNQKDEKKQSIWLQDAFTKDFSTIIFEDLEAVMSAYQVSKEGMRIGGKTGTAEVGEEQLGWVSLVTIEENTPISLTLMIENAKAKGGSVYTLELIRELVSSVL